MGILDPRLTITLISPYKVPFTALWRGNDRSFERKVGVFDVPGFTGSITQDKGVKSTAYPLTFYFYGEYHDLVSKGFADALKNHVGLWSIVHPTLGILRLQLMSATEKIQPVESADYREWTTEWLEPAAENSILSALQSAQAAFGQIIAVIQTVKAQLQQIKTDFYSGTRSAVATARSASASTTETVGGLASLDTETSATFTATSATLSTSLTEFLDAPEDPKTLDAVADAMITLVTTPVTATDDYPTRSSLYEELIADFATLAPEKVSVEDFNAVLMMELSIVSAMIAYAQIILTSAFRTRVEVVDAMDDIGRVYTEATNQLETIQNTFIHQDIDNQYFSQSQTFIEIEKLFAIVIDYLLNQFFNLSAEKRFTLTTDRSPLEITVTEYGDLGENEDNYQLFIDSNNLTGDEILLLPAGREVVVYV